jgi:ABC-type transport system substrate-binding protein
VPELSDTWLTMNVKISPFSDVHFRRAVAYAIDRNAIADGVLRGTVTPLYAWYPQGIMGFVPDIQKQPGVPSYDPAMAQKEMAMAKKDLGSIPPVPLEYNAGNTDRARVTLLIQQELKAIGITVTPKPVPDAQWIKDGNTDKTPFIYNGWLADYPDPQDWSDYIIETGASENWGAYSNPAVDKLFVQGAAERDTATRASLYKQAQLIILRDAAGAMLYQPVAYNLISTKYHGVELNPAWANFPQPVKNDWANVTVSP